jgi:hypothetical protein
MRAEDFGYRPDEYSADNFRRRTMMSVLAHGLFAPPISRPPTGMLMRTVVEEVDYSGTIQSIRIVKNPVLSKRQKRRWRGRLRSLI